MKISINQLRHIIKEEMTNVTQVKKKVTTKKPVKKVKDIIRPTGKEYVWDSEYFMDGDWPSENEDGVYIDYWLESVPGLNKITTERLEAEIEAKIGDVVSELGGEQAEYADNEDEYMSEEPPMWRVTVVLHPTGNPKKPYTVLVHSSD